MRRLAAFCVVAVVLTAAAGCASAQPTVVKTPRDITLSSSELPSGFRAILDQENTIDTLAGQFTDPADKKAKFQQHGFTGSWRREYERDTPTGVSFVRSGATLFGDAAGASFGVTSNADRSSTDASSRKLSLEAVGDESYAFEFDERLGSRDLTTYVIYFRYANVSNVLVVSGARGTVDVAVAIDLSKRQLARAR